jgi:two-component system, NarL family, nitrate/nitrite response regulator NarL
MGERGRHRNLGRSARDGRRSRQHTQQREHRQGDHDNGQRHDGEYRRRYVLRKKMVRQGLFLKLCRWRPACQSEGRDFSSVLDLMNKGVSPRLVIADIGCLREKDFEDLRRMRDAAPECRIAVLSDHLNLDDLGRVFRAGADGYLVSDLSRAAFSLSLLVIMSGEKVLPGALADVLVSNYRDFVSSKLSNGHVNLTERERQILQCLVHGDSNKVIARMLDITEGTVKVHLKTLMRKIAAGNRTQAALWARSNGIGDDVDTAAGATPVPTAPPGKFL